MKRLIALLCLVMLAVFVGEAGAINFQHVTGRQLRWADYTNDVATAWRDTSVFSNTDVPDTTEPVQMAELGLFPINSAVSNAASAVARFVVTTRLAGVASQDSIIVGVDGAYSPAGPWIAGADVGYVVGAVGTFNYSSQLLMDPDGVSGVTGQDILYNFPYVRFRVRNDATHGGMTAARFYLYHMTISDIEPHFTWKQLRWVQTGVRVAATSEGAGQYSTITYSDTTSLYFPADTTSGLTAVDTTEAIDCTKIQYLGLNRIGTQGWPYLTVLLSGTTTSGQSDSVGYYVDTAPTSLGPWSESTNPDVIVRANTDGYNWYNMPASVTAVTTMATNGLLTAYAPYIRIRAKMYSKLDAGAAGLRGVKVFVKYLQAGN